MISAPAVRPGAWLDGLQTAGAGSLPHNAPQFPPARNRLLLCSEQEYLPHPRRAQARRTLPQQQEQQQLALPLPMQPAAARRAEGMAGLGADWQPQGPSASGPKVRPGRGGGWRAWQGSVAGAARLNVHRLGCASRNWWW